MPPAAGTSTTIAMSTPPAYWSTTNFPTEKPCCAGFRTIEKLAVKPPLRSGDQHTDGALYSQGHTAHKSESTEEEGSTGA